MNTQFDHILLSSFYLWFEHELISSNSKAYVTNLSNEFKKINFTDLPSNVYGYQGMYRQLVADNSVDVINSGIFINGNFISGGTPNIFLDYDNGRVIVPKASGASLTITANSTVKEINTYIANDDDEHLLIHGDFVEQNASQPYFYNKDNQLDEKTYFLPACFISLTNSENEEFSFGGEENTKTRIHVTVVTKDDYLLDSVLSYFRDRAREMIVHIPYEQYPYGRFSSIKNYPYSYEALKNSQTITSANVSLIDKVSCSKITNSAVRKAINKDFSVGFLDFDLETYRFPRI